MFYIIIFTLNLDNKFKQFTTCILFMRYRSRTEITAMILDTAYQENNQDKNYV